MADKQDNTGKQGVSYYEETDVVYCCGSKKELLDSGMFPFEWFASVGKRPVTIGLDALRAAGFNPLIAEVRIEKRADGAGVFDVQMSYTEEEADRRAAIAQAEFAARTYREASNRASDFIDGLPSGADAFKRRGIHLIERNIEIIFDGIVRSCGGYSYTKKTVREFEDAINLACSILRNGEVEYCQFERDNEVRQLAGEAFNRDACLSLTGHERNAWIERYLRERKQVSAAA